MAMTHFILPVLGSSSSTTLALEQSFNCFSLTLGMWVCYTINKLNVGHLPYKSEFSEDIYDFSLRWEI